MHQLYQQRTTFTTTQFNVERSRKLKIKIEHFRSIHWLNTISTNYQYHHFYYFPFLIFVLWRRCRCFEVNSFITLSCLSACLSISVQCNPAPVWQKSRSFNYCSIPTFLLQSRRSNLAVIMRASRKRSARWLQEYCSIHDMTYVA